MKTKKIALIGVICVLALVALGVILYIVKNANGLTINEKNWLDEARQSNQVININVINDADVFGSNGSGVFYDFINDFKNDYSVNINEITYNYGNTINGITLGVKTNIDKSDKVFYMDHYVLVGKKYTTINAINNLNGKTIGVLNNELSYISNYLKDSTISYKTYDSKETLLSSFNDNEYIIVPLHLYLKDIIKNNLRVCYHFSDINIYFTLTAEDSEFGSIISKYYDSWKTKYSDYYNANLFTLVTNNLNISSTEIDAMRSMTYEYGYINNSPYEVISGGNYGGIAAVYLKGFIDFADVDFNFKKYSSFNRFTKAIAKGNVDIFFGYSNLTSDFSKTDGGLNSSYVVIANIKNSVVVNSLNSLIGKTVYVDKNSIFTKYLSAVNGINIKYYNSNKELVRFNKKDEIILLDKNIFEYYKSHGLENYSVRYEKNLDYIYGFNVKNSSAMYKLLNAYLNISDPNQILIEGLYNHEKTVRSGRIIGFIAKYFIAVVCILVIILLMFIRKTKKIVIAKKIKKDDKIRFIDQLTLLKNRSYLSENIKKWGNNNIYPQTILVIDLNRLQSINDIEGYEEGDKQIKAAANALIKTQLDNSDIIRTDGNEFVVYMVGYSQKQITNYIHKLNKEFKKLPYNYGAEYGYSMILDDIKTIEDALNEATKILKEKKEENEKKD